MRVLIDTNVLIDHFGQRAPFFSVWEKLHVMQIFGDIELWVAPQSFADAFYILSKAVSCEALQAAFIESLGFLNVCNVGQAEVLEACKRGWHDYEDCLVALCAENINADYLLTRDASDFKRSNVPCCTPERFLQILEDEYGLGYDTVGLGI